MLKRLLFVGALLLGAACFRTTRNEVVPRPIDAGVPFAFGDEKGPLLEWDFGDGSPKVVAKSVRRAFQKAGRYTVTGTSGDFVAWQLKLEVVPRALPLAVPADAEALLYSLSIRDDFSATVDFLERLVGPQSAQRYLETSVLPSMAVDEGAGESQLADPKEGVGLFLLPGFHGQVSLLGIVDEVRALTELKARLGERGRVTMRDDGLLLVELGEGEAAMAAFVDRGYAYVVLADPGQNPLAAVERVQASDARGLTATKLFTAASIEGQLKLYASAGGGGDEKQFDAVHLGFVVNGARARLDGEVRSTGPLWEKTAAAPLQLFEKAPASPVAAAMLTLPPKTLAAVLAGQVGSERRQRNEQAFKTLGVDLEQMLASLLGSLGAVAYFDAEAFLRNLVDGTQRPEPRGTVLVEAGLQQANTFEAGLMRLLATMQPPPQRKRQGDVTRFETRYAEQPVALSVAPGSVRLEGGSALAGRATVALGQQLAEEYDGAFGPGHVSVLLDLGQLREELQVPRMISGLDTTRVVTVQGFASAFLDQLTPVDHVLIDLVPTPSGASVSGRIVLKEREK